MPHNDPDKAILAQAMKLAAVDWAKQKGLKLTPEQALSRWVKTKDGKKSREMYNQLLGASVPQPQPAVKQEPTGALKKLYELGEGIRKGEPSLTVEQAFAKALKERPELYQQYRHERLGR